MCSLLGRNCAEAAARPFQRNTKKLKIEIYFAVQPILIAAVDYLLLYGSIFVAVYR